MLSPPQALHNYPWTHFDGISSIPIRNSSRPILHLPSSLHTYETLLLHPLRPPFLLSPADSAIGSALQIPQLLYVLKSVKRKE